MFRTACYVLHRPQYHKSHSSVCSEQYVMLCTDRSLTSHIVQYVPNSMLHYVLYRPQSHKSHSVHARIKFLY